MFRRLVEKAPAKAHGHHKHSTKLRSVRYAEHAAPAKPPARSRKPQRTVYDVANGETLPGKLVRKEGGKPASDTAAEQAFDNAGIALAFFREVFGRNSVDGKGLPIVSAVHYGQAFENAMWNGRQMIYGDGDEHVGNFTAALDIIAHELSHGVTQYLIPGGLGVERIPAAEREFKEQRYRLTGQSGALNESFSDVMGSLVKQWHARETVREADWLIGEKVLARGMGRAVRSLKSPGNERVTWRGDEQMRSMDQYYEGCDVHDASGIPSHAFYQAAMKIGGHAWEKAGHIWFEAYDNLSRTAQFADFAQATLAVAAKRHGEASLPHNAVHAAWRKVKVLG
ncbi:M4 family metallopeptidase [Ramlibacter sp. GTP1]|uniref:Neutral metalloproteinase n=2 Tax=Ramlibacter albus TaxID=2079448 RepID=A0A923M5P1_9BURK|nr:M4 family metallopeptidase [Ramlibacter albus]MBC5763378.1 M4 family metallopeptidase [Ramlibacter albus]